MLNRTRYLQPDGTLISTTHAVALARTRYAYYRDKLRSLCASSLSFNALMQGTEGACSVNRGTGSPTWFAPDSEGILRSRTGSGYAMVITTPLELGSLDPELDAMFKEATPNIQRIQHRIMQLGIQTTQGNNTILWSDANTIVVVLAGIPTGEHTVYGTKLGTPASEGAEAPGIWVTRQVMDVDDGYEVEDSDGRITTNDGSTATFIYAIDRVIFAGVDPAVSLLLADLDVQMDVPHRKVLDSLVRDMAEAIRFYVSGVLLTEAPVAAAPDEAAEAEYVATIRSDASTQLTNVLEGIDRLIATKDSELKTRISELAALRYNKQWCEEMVIPSIEEGVASIVRDLRSVECEGVQRIEVRPGGLRVMCDDVSCLITRESDHSTHSAMLSCYIDIAIKLTHTNEAMPPSITVTPADNINLNGIEIPVPPSEAGLAMARRWQEYPVDAMTKYIAYARAQVASYLSSHPMKGR